MFLDGQDLPEGGTVPETGFLNNPYNPKGLYDGIPPLLPLFRLTAASGYSSPPIHPVLEQTCYLI